MQAFVFFLLNRNSCSLNKRKGKRDPCYSNSKQNRSLARKFHEDYIGDQLKHLLNKDPGFDSKQVIVINAISASPALRTVMKTKLIADLNILAVGMCSIPPGEKLFNMGVTLPENRSVEDRRIGVYQSFVDHDYLKGLGVDINEGRFFDELMDGDSNAYVIINKAAEKEIGAGVMNKNFNCQAFSRKNQKI